MRKSLDQRKSIDQESLEIDSSLIKTKKSPSHAAILAHRNSHSTPPRERGNEKNKDGKIQDKQTKKLNLTE